jgi:DNA-binding NarL/FixJ family response regulator
VIKHTEIGDAMKFLIIDDHPMLREGIAAQLRLLAADVLVLQAGDGQQGMAMAAEHERLDAALVDLDIGGQSGLLVVKALRRAYASLPVIVISGSESASDVRASIAAGARGYCPKSGSAESLLAAIRMVMSGQVYLPPLMLNATPTHTDRAGYGNAVGVGTRLTKRQIEVLRELCEGHPNKNIARRLGMEEKTVKTHVTAIFRTLGVVNRVQAAARARTGGLVN